MKTKLVYLAVALTLVIALSSMVVPAAVAADTTSPAAPTGLCAVAGDTQASVDWNGNTEPDLAGYNVYRSTTSGGLYTEIDNTTVSDYTDTGLANGTTYYYVVTALDTSSNESGYSNEASATPHNPHYIYTPSTASVSPIAGDPEGDSFQLTVGLAWSPKSEWWVEAEMLVVLPESPFIFSFDPPQFYLNETNSYTKEVLVTITAPEGTAAGSRTIKAKTLNHSGPPNVGPGSGCIVTITVSEAPTPTPTPTPPAEEVDLGIAVVVFEDVQQGGDTTASTTETSPCGPIPSNYVAVGSFVEITTTVIYGGVVAGIKYDESQADNEVSLRLFHCAGTHQWEDVTTYVDTVNNIVYGQPTTLSPFAVGEPAAAEPPPPSEEGAGCFIATAAYGTSSAEEIDVLRAFRDQVLLESALGSQFVAWYYQASPPLAEFISGNSLLRAFVRELVIDPMVSLAEITQGIWED